jgi:LysM repeat protein
MKKILVCLLMMIGAFVGYTNAKEPPPPYTDAVRMVYYEDDNPTWLDNWMWPRNVCLESFLRLNPTVDINHVPYGTPLYIPTDEPCYLYRTQRPVHEEWWGKPPRLKFYENGRWLDEPYYSEDVFYVNGWAIKQERWSGTRTITVQEIADYFGVCLDDLLAENYLLQRYDDYSQYYGYSMDIFVPRYLPPCHPYVAPKPDADDITIIEGDTTIFSPLYFSRSVYNVCIEEIMTSQLRNAFYDTYYRQNTSTITVEIPNNAPPCYNEQGQRLKYYDDTGARLETPVYSDLPVYIARAGETITSIATLTGVCIINLMQVNGYPSMPLLVDIELFLPPISTEPCDDNIQLVVVNSQSVEAIALITNTCPDTILALNPYLDIYRLQTSTFYRDRLILVSPDPCYQEYITQTGDSIYDIEKTLNVCFEEFYFTRDRNGLRDTMTFHRVMPYPHITIIIMYAIDAPPCYNELGQRLYYANQHQSGRQSMPNPITPTYSSMPVYAIQPSDTVYGISKRFNVCVRDLLSTNIILRQFPPLPENHPIFIPQTRPCYDTETGMPILYEDADGNPLSQPQIGEHLVYYGSHDDKLPYYYNVCINRIRDANHDKYDTQGNAQYLGTIIPTDRPPCYDANWNFIEYVCYNQPIDFDTDYLATSTSITFDVHGTHCYDLKDPNTVIWYDNKPYKVIYHRGTLFESRSFTAWCFGVSLDDINTINADETFLPILPYYTRAIPQPTRECYLENPDILVGKIVHTVGAGDTLASIGQQYGVPYPIIARVNQLDGDNTIWVGQKLIIPTGTWTEDIQWLLGLWSVWGILAIAIYGKRILARRG